MKLKQGDIIYFSDINSIDIFILNLYYGGCYFSKFENYTLYKVLIDERLENGYAIILGNINY